MKSLALEVSQQFTDAVIKDIAVLGNGLINDTFLIKTDKTAFVLQRINTQVFPDPGQIMENMGLLNQHINQKNKAEIKLIIPGVIKTREQQSYYYLDQTNSYWRALEFVEKGVSKEKISEQYEAEQIGFALGHFHYLLNDVATDLFHDTLPGFHITPNYFQHYQKIEKSEGKIIRSNKLERCKGFIDKFKPKINTLENAKNKGLLFERITHGDPKLNNFLFDEDTHKIVSIVDLDTVKPGLVHYDIADCLRSCCHQSPSNTFDLDLFEMVLNSYLNEAAGFFTRHDYDFLYPAIELLPFELGLRFFTDYLQGNLYFKVDSAEQNLHRAWAQFQLCENIGKKEAEIRQLIMSIRSKLF